MTDLSKETIELELLQVKLDSERLKLQTEQANLQAAEEGRRAPSWLRIGAISSVVALIATIAGILVSINTALQTYLQRDREVLLRTEYLNAAKFTRIDDRRRVIQFVMATSTDDSLKNWLKEQDVGLGKEIELINKNLDSKRNELSNARRRKADAMEVIWREPPERRDYKQLGAFESEEQRLVAEVQQLESRVSPESSSALPELPPNLVLWVDNMPTNNTYLRRHFESSGVRVVNSPSTEDALIALTQEKFTLVLTDSNRPNEGREAALLFLKEMRKAGIGVPVIVYSSSLGKEGDASAKALGAIGSTNNPFEMLAWARTVLPTLPPLPSR